MSKPLRDWCAQNFTILDQNEKEKDEQIMEINATTNSSLKIRNSGSEVF